MTHSFMSACSRAIWKNRLERVLATDWLPNRNNTNKEEIMSTENVKLVMELDRQLMAALARMEHIPEWTPHLTARKVLSGIMSTHSPGTT
jgi:hypothetical protein